MTKEDLLQMKKLGVVSATITQDAMESTLRWFEEEYTDGWAIGWATSIVPTEHKGRWFKFYGMEFHEQGGDGGG